MQGQYQLKMDSLITAMAFLLGMFLLSAKPAGADDGIFPPSSAAKPFINFDGRGFLIGGKREFIASGSLHYPRVPRALWRDRLLRIKRAGFNTVQTYAFWNYHEPKEGKWDFSGEKDLDAFLKLIHELDMYAIVRPGPYVCAEWDSGGYPVWLRFKPGVIVREDNPQFEAAVDRWLEKVMPIIVANQINHGGSVIMVQLENEHPKGWGKEMPNGYFRHLRDKAVALGLEVPYFFSGLHHGDDPAGNEPWDTSGRTNPWFSTEFWPGWYNLYGPLDPDRFTKFERGTWKILAFGGNGFNFYMLHGGTNFDTSNDDEVASSYDYGSAIGQTGDLRPIYYRFKNVNLFARSFAEILENSDNVRDSLTEVTDNPVIRVTARKSDAGTILFLDNRAKTSAKVKLKDRGNLVPTIKPLTLSPGEIFPIVKDYKLTSGVTLELAAARILGIAQNGAMTTLVIYDQINAQNTYSSIGGAYWLRFKVNSPVVTIMKGESSISRDPNAPDKIILSGTFPATTRLTELYTQQKEILFSVGNEKIRILVLSEPTAEHTWFLNSGSNTNVVTGPMYIGDFTEKENRLLLTMESKNGRSNAPPPAKLYGNEIEPRAILSDSTVKMDGYETPNLIRWEYQKAIAAANPDFFPSKWKFSINPVPMGADGDTSAYAWYRSNIHVAKPGTYSLYFSDVGDWLSVYINGARVGNSDIQQRFDRPRPRTLLIPLKSGINSLAVFTAHYGRHKLFNYIGPLDTIDAKGLSGVVNISSEIASIVPLLRWRWKEAQPADSMKDHIPAHLASGGTDWSNAAIGEDVFHGRQGFAWYHTELLNIKGPHRRLHFETIDDNATVFVNGQKLFTHKGYNLPFDLKLDKVWREGGPNELAILVENTSGPGGIMGAATLRSNGAEDGKPVQGWRMHGGLEALESRSRGWQPLTARAQFSTPAFFRSEFESAPQTSLGAHPILRVSLEGMSRGFVWLNGHNLGRYPEKTPANGIYLPECWIQNGRNTLSIFDEEGNLPAQVHIALEEASSRFELKMTSEKAPL